MATAAQNIPQTSSQVIERFQHEAPVDVIGIANTLGLTVWEDNIQPYSGKLFRDEAHGGASGFSIVVNERESTERKRFTIAHEVSHFILHLDDALDEPIEETLFRGGLSTAKEVEANKLAAEILMPLPLIAKLITSGKKSVNEIASALEVSRRALEIRLGADQSF